MNIIRFPPSQALPHGYSVEWWESDEHYRWVSGEDYSDIYADRWVARRSAWAHYRRHGAA
jgi:hypothetical protein